MNVAANVPALSIRRADRLDLAFQPWDWPFVRERRAEIDAHFAAAQGANGALWNGRVLLLRDPQDHADHFSARYFETDFASFLAWRDWGCPDKTVFNGFGMGALRGNDGVFVLGEMSAHTANHGRIYFPSGTPDPNDLRGDRVDMAESVAREVEEEAGLVPSDYRAADHWHCVRTGQWIAFMRVLEVADPAEELRRRILQNLASQTAPELSAIHLVRDRRDFTDAMPLFITGYIEAMTAKE
ncbi:NUDIX hydrolase [Bradyrhizobium prioriisuperbiae]|uniref:NUDIX hydrolase n=1 Tax=Bradyrhizobium prioriisuperbiae TaxID=2854389 RepID=UPI0028E56091|nr:NUDIX hydrolase [Bradyrhizobium prioritasuperba]